MNAYAPPEYDAAHPAQKLAWRPCVGIVLLNKDGLVFTGKRVVGKLPADAPLWQLPQGGIDDGETPEQAAFRELEEETGVTEAKIIYELPEWLSYDLPEALIGTALKGRFRGQKQKWFAMQLLGDDTHVRLDRHDPIEFDDWKWRPLSQCVELVIDFKKPLYATLAQRFSFLTPDRVEPASQP
jgi:putative (di)nucleoside polyphosphate hydrolase